MGGEILNGVTLKLIRGVLNGFMHGLSIEAQIGDGRKVGIPNFKSKFPRQTPESMAIQSKSAGVALRETDQTDFM